MSTVISFNGKRAQRQLPTAVSIHECILDIAPRLVPAGAVVVLMYVAGRCGHSAASISYTEMQRALGKHRAVLSRHIKTLEDNQLVKIKRARTGKVAATNEFEIDFNGLLGGAMARLKEPKQKKNPMKGGSNIVRPPSPGVVTFLHGSNISTKVDALNKNNTSTKVDRRRPAAKFSTIAEAVAESSRRVKRTRAKKAEKAARPGGQLTLAGTKAVWATAMLKHYPRVPAVEFTGKDFIIFKQRVRPILATSGLGEFFDWAVGEWRWLRENKFKWLRAKGKDLSVAPSLPELMRYWKVFAQAFADSRIDGEDVSRRTAQEDAQDAVAAAQAERDRIATENATLRERLARAERLGAAAPTTTDAPKRSLTARRRQSDEAYNGDDLPAWRDE